MWGEGHGFPPLKANMLKSFLLFPYDQQLVRSYCLLLTCQKFHTDIIARTCILSYSHLLFGWFTSMKSCLIPWRLYTHEAEYNYLEQAFSFEWRESMCLAPVFGKRKSDIYVCIYIYTPIHACIWFCSSMFFLDLWDMWYNCN